MSEERAVRALKLIQEELDFVPVALGDNPRQLLYDGLIQRAVVCALERIGEAIARLPDELKARDVR